MRAPDFWWREEPSLAARLLSPAGVVYGAVTARRMARPGARAALPVICVGNFVAGGAGKTPAAMAVARLLVSAGERPAFLSRGYGGRLAGPVVVEAGTHDAAEVGDEALLLARQAPTVVARDRVAGAALAAAHGATVIVMDDGLQNPSLAKDLALAVVDGESGVGNGLCLPAGPLRAPLSAQRRHVDAVVVVGPGRAGTDAAEAAAVPVLRALLVPERAAAAALSGQRVVAFAGIGRPEKFFATLAALGAILAERLAFADHHPFTDADIAGLARRASGRDLIATTEKDAARLTPAQRDILGGRLAVLPVALAFDDEAAIRTLLAGALSRRRAV